MMIQLKRNGFPAAVAFTVLMAVTASCESQTKTRGGGGLRLRRPGEVSE